MADTVALQLWAGRASFVVLAAVAIFLRLLPIDFTPGGLPSPDLLLCVTAAWVLRRPAQVPPLLIVAVFLLCDFVFLRPPGLWTALVLAVTEFLRTREAATRELPFVAEWAIVAAVFVAATLAEAVALGILLVPSAGAGAALLDMLATLLMYPLVVVALRVGLGLRRAAPGETDKFGRAV